MKRLHLVLAAAALMLAAPQFAHAQQDTAKPAKAAHKMGAKKGAKAEAAKATQQAEKAEKTSEKAEKTSKMAHREAKMATKEAKTAEKTAAKAEGAGEKAMAKGTTKGKGMHKGAKKDTTKS